MGFHVRALSARAPRTELCALACYHIVICILVIVPLRVCGGPQQTRKVKEGRVGGEVKMAEAIVLYPGGYRGGVEE